MGNQGSSCSSALDGLDCTALDDVDVDRSRSLGSRVRGTCREALDAEVAYFFNKCDGGDRHGRGGGARAGWDPGVGKRTQPGNFMQASQASVDVVKRRDSVWRHEPSRANKSHDETAQQTLKMSQLVALHKHGEISDGEFLVAKARLLQQTSQTVSKSKSFPNQRVGFDDSACPAADNRAQDLPRDECSPSTLHMRSSVQSTPVSRVESPAENRDAVDWAVAAQLYQGMGEPDVHDQSFAEQVIVTSRGRMADRTAPAPSSLTMAARKHFQSTGNGGEARMREKVAAAVSEANRQVEEQKKLLLDEQAKLLNLLNASRLSSSRASSANVESSYWLPTGGSSAPTRLIPVANEPMMVSPFANDSGSSEQCGRDGTNSGVKRGIIGVSLCSSSGKKGPLDQAHMSQVDELDRLLSKVGRQEAKQLLLSGSPRALGNSHSLPQRALPANLKCWRQDRQLVI